MNVFCDLHHDGLYYSLHLLFEKRLGWNLFRPIGKEWFRQGYWAIARPYGDNPGTIDQYLSLNNVPSDGTPPLNSVAGIAPTHYSIRDEAHDFTQKAITLNQFKEMNIDIIIASIPDHWLLYSQLRDDYHPSAKVICHMGNMFNEVRRMVAEGVVENLMAATIPFQLNRPINTVFYHEEQPIRDFMPPMPENRNKIKSFVNVLPKQEQYFQYKKELWEKEMKAFGASCPDGMLPTLNKVYDEMQGSDWIYHVKPGGDGFGWVWHSAYMLGRPVITNFSDYKNKLGGLLFEHKVTGIDLEQGTVKENCELLSQLSDPEKHLEMCIAAHKRFCDVVSYNAEEKNIRNFLNNCT